jgi:hypothetical protein
MPCAAEEMAAYHSALQRHLSNCFAAFPVDARPGAERT